LEVASRVEEKLLIGPGAFPTTSWGAVQKAAEADSADSTRALANLCEAYWHPLYFYIRHRGYGVEDASDLTQEFFARLLEKHYLRDVQPERGRFRSFLLACLKHFLLNDLERCHAGKRGGGRPPLRLDLDGAEKLFSTAQTQTASPERIFERQWALTMLHRVLDRLREEFAGRSNVEQFDRLKGYVMGEVGRVPYAQVAETLGMTEGAVKVAVHRLRERLGLLLRREIASTVADPAEVDDEIRFLLESLRY
jgi:RNA polymerase sigma-70 factor (ECF subfamily)